jgi:hypothetical protein
MHGFLGIGWGWILGLLLLAVIFWMLFRASYRRRPGSNQQDNYRDVKTAGRPHDQSGRSPYDSPADREGTTGRPEEQRRDTSREPERRQDKPSTSQQRTEEVRRQQDLPDSHLEERTKNQPPAPRQEQKHDIHREQGIRPGQTHQKGQGTSEPAKKQGDQDTPDSHLEERTKNQPPAPRQEQKHDVHREQGIRPGQAQQKGQGPSEPAKKHGHQDTPDRHPEERTRNQTSGPGQEQKRDIPREQDKKEDKPGNPPQKRDNPPGGSQGSDRPSKEGDSPYDKR